MANTNVKRVKTADLELKDRLVAIQRVTKVTKGGRHFRFAAIVVVGDENGVVGYGLGKANEVTAAIAKGVEDAKKNLNGRNGILGSHITFGSQNRGWNFVSPGHGDVDFDNIARRTPGFSGAQLANVLNEAALLAVRLGHSVITLEDVDEAIDRVIGGPAKKSRKYTEKERKLVAYHESGHAIVGLTLEDANQVQKVTIVPRGDAGGYNLMTPKDETYFETKQQLLAEIAGFMGGRVAEEIFFGDISSGAANDIQQATRIARMMVTELGMSELGPIKYDSGENAVFLGRDYSQLSNTHSGQIAFEIDQQVRKIIDDAHQEATDIINANKDKLETIANALLEYETLNAEQIQSLYETGKMPETFNGNDEVVTPDNDDNTPSAPETKDTVNPEDDLLDEMK